VSKKFIKDYHKILKALEDIGYTTFTKVLNAKDFCIPQNRERVFGVSILCTDEVPMPKYHFPKPKPLEVCLADVLEEDVEEKYFLSDEMLARFCEKSMEEENPCGDTQGTMAEDGETDFEDFFIAQ
jgi:DNA (cytosine-5)-methyltransferase 1